MGPDEGQRQLGDLVSELFEPTVFLSPLFDLGDEINGDVNGVGLGFDLPGQIVAEVFLAAGTAAVGIAAGAEDGDEAGGQDGAAGLEFLLAGLELAADKGGVFWDIHEAKQGCVQDICN